jgi:hypothetical protein
MSTSIRPLHGILVNNVSTHASNNSNVTEPYLEVQSSRSVLVQNVSPDTTWQNLKDHLRAAGTVERCEFPDDRKAGRRWKGYATVTFRTKEEARRAVALFDNSLFRGAKIRVRFGKETRGGAAGATKGGVEECDENGNVTGTKGTAIGRPKLGGLATGKAVKNSVINAGKKIDNCEPLVVNGSCIGLRSGRSTQETTGQEGWFCYSSYSFVPAFLPPFPLPPNNCGRTALSSWSRG